MLSTAPHHPFITIFATTIAIARHCNIRRRRKRLAPERSPDEENTRAQKQKEPHPAVLVVSFARAFLHSGA